MSPGQGNCQSRCGWRAVTTGRCWCAVICRLLGVPHTDREFFETQTRRLLTGPEHSDIEDARLRLLTYLDGLLAAKAEASGEGLLDELVAGQAENAVADRHELVGIGFVLLLGGIETTANMIALSTFTLLEHPDQAAELRVDDSLLPGAVEELLRFLSITDGIMRVAAAEIEIGGHADSHLVTHTAGHADHAGHAGLACQPPLTVTT